MEKTEEELKQMAISSPSFPASAAEPEPKVREEGELSSDDDVETPTVLVSPPPAATQPTRIELTKTTTMSVDRSRPCLQSFNRNKFERNTVPLKSSTSGRFLPSRTDNNLVIKFSDSDSSSDYEDDVPDKSPESRVRDGGRSRERRPPVSMPTKPEFMQANNRSRIMPVPKKLSLCLPFVAAVAELNGFKSRGSAPYSMEHVSRPRDSGEPSKNFVNHQLGHNHGVDLGDGKLQDLREQIEVLESELKLKSSQQSKETVSVPWKGHMDASTIQTIGAFKKGRAASEEPEEAQNKRAKVSKPYSPRLKSDNLQEVPIASPNIMPKEPLTSGEGNMQENMDVHYRQHDKIHISTRVQPARRKQDGNQLGFPLGTVNASTNDCADPKGDWRQQVSSIGQENLDAVRTALPNIPNSSPSLKESVTCRHKSNSKRSNGNCKVVSGDKRLLAVYEKLESAEDSPKDAVLWNCKDTVNDSGPEDTSLQSIFELEQLREKELNEAQEYRRRCEIEERNALRDYRKAQMTLLEANARCRDLYLEKEVLSARFQSSLMENLSFMWPSRHPEHSGMRLNYPNDISGGNRDLVPKLDHHLSEYGVSSRRGCNSNIHSMRDAPIRASYRQFDGRHIGSDPSSEPDGSTSDVRPHKGSRSPQRVRSQSNDSNNSADDDEDTFSCDKEYIERNQGYVEREKVRNGFGSRNYPIKDTVLLEASLRSKLVAQLGTRSLSKRSSQSDDKMETLLEREAGSDPQSENRQRGMEGLPFSVAEKAHHPDLQGMHIPEKNVSKIPNHADDQLMAEPDTEELQPEKVASEVLMHTGGQLTAEPLAEELWDSTQQTVYVDISPSSISQSASGQVKGTSLKNLRGSLQGASVSETSNKKNEEYSDVMPCAIHCGSLAGDSMQAIHGGLFAREISSYSSNLEIDPFWPLCMFELRGRCNNDECTWQHSKDYYKADSHVGSLVEQGKDNDAQILGECWQKVFSVYLAVSRLLQRESMAELMHLHKDGRMETQGSWSRLSLYFQNGIENQPKQDLGDYTHSLDRALTILSQEAHKTEGMKKALSVMSRALEISPTSVPVWVVYLLICNSNKKLCGNNVDLFSHAVKHNEGSYELWILYINSRMLHGERTQAYSAALTAICRSASNSNDIYTSACILDLFLQMMYFLCMSNKCEEAIRRIHNLLLSTTKSSDPHTPLPSGLLTLLTLSDRCTFRVCCLYIVMYRKLPDAVLQQFERDKDLVLEEWPSTEIDFQKKELAIKMIEKATDSIQMDTEDGSLQSMKVLGSLHVFALNHVRCVEALQGQPCCQDLLKKYTKLYPSCIELYLMSARMQGDGLRDLTCAGFNEALDKWPKELPGIQCIWNKYLQYALENEGIDVVKEVMLRWFHSVLSVQNSQDGVNGDNAHKPSSENVVAFGSNKLDKMFGMLNLGHYRLFENDRSEAQFAFDSALKAAPVEYYKHCVREHTTFLRMCASQSGDSSFCLIFNDLRSYLADDRSSPCSEPLSRRFIQDIKKPRLQNLIKDILSPISSNVSLVNLVLEVWYGPSILPSKFDKLKDLVDFVENIIELAPSNYQIAFSVCERIIRDYNSPSALYWASSILAGTLFNSLPVLPEHVFTEASGIVQKIKGIQGFSEMFHTRALEVYPFSIKLWKSHLKCSKSTEDKRATIQAAKERGIKLD